MDVTNTMDAFYEEQIKQEEKRDKILWDKLDRAFVEQILYGGDKIR